MPDDLHPQLDIRESRDCYQGGKGPPLVLLHGVGGTWHIWRPMLSALQRHHRVYVPPCRSACA